jgi:hypothetical protein
MGDVRFADLEPVTPRDPNSFFSKKEWEKYQKQKMEVYGEGNYLKKLNDLYKENYIKAMQNALGNESKKLQDYIRKMPMDKFMREAFTENNAHINFVYDRLSIKARVQELERVWGLGA